MKKKNSTMPRLISALEAFAIIVTVIFGMAVPSFASDDDVISEQQAYDLMAEARLLCAYVNQLDTIDTAPSGFLPDGFSIDDYYYKGEYLYTADTVNAILKLPQKVYSKDISDKAWKTSIENNSLKSILLITEEDLDKDKDYMKNTDGAVILYFHL